MRKYLGALLAMGALLAACGGDDDDATNPDVTAPEADGGASDDGAAGDTGSSDDGAGSAGGSDGVVTDPAPPGQATASVDGLEISFEMQLVSGCAISDEAISFGFATADGTTTVAAGLNQSDGAWMGSIALDVPNPDGEGVIGYYSSPAEGITLAAGSVAVSGSSMTYTGPILMQPVNDGSNPPPVDVGDGTIAATC